jgi:hypothetical protein
MVACVRVLAGLRVLLTKRRWNFVGRCEIEMKKKSVEKKPRKRSGNNGGVRPGSGRPKGALSGNVARDQSDGKYQAGHCISAQPNLKRTSIFGRQVL